jgi:hypothetical protein
MSKMRGKIIFEGSFLDYLIKNILIFLLCVILAIPTFGISLLYFVYWQVKYFFNNMTIELE